MATPGPDFVLADPKSLAKQIARTMLDGETEGLLLTVADQPAGTLTKQHRSSGGGLLSGLKRFVQGRDWVFKPEQAAMSTIGSERGGLAALSGLALVAIVSLEFNSPD